ncbi:hypothetical protein CIK05_10760 [Bdellovibrio sp. qaytius]|nr:hypothetical protein CIK05_10760 [Bdellovibrio sp. qaytius]
MKDTFKPLFCAPSFYTEYQDSFRIIDAAVNDLQWDKTSEVMLWTALLAMLRRRTDWFQGVSSNVPQSSNSIAPHYEVYTLVQKLNIDWPHKLSKEISFAEFLRTVKIKPLPAVAQKAMYFIFTQKYPITVLDYEPSPRELLQIQCEGRRIITFKNDFSQWPTQKFGKRDPLSFWLHDCIHAEHFFSQPEIYQSQLGFYKFVSDAHAAQCWPDLSANPQFEGDFSYLISDMNSHPLHLFKTLKAITDIHFKEQSLSIWDRVITSCLGSTEELNALRKLNTAYFVDNDIDALLQMTKRLGAQSYTT